MTKREKQEIQELKNAVDRLIHRQRKILAAIKLSGIDIEMSCLVSKPNLNKSVTLNYGN